MTSLCIMKRGYNEIFSFPLACPIAMFSGEYRNSLASIFQNAITLLSNLQKHSRLKV